MVFVITFAVAIYFFCLLRKIPGLLVVFLQGVYLCCCSFTR